jgi:hypothetical protein
VLDDEHAGISAHPSPHAIASALNIFLGGIDPGAMTTRLRAGRKQRAASGTER